MKAAKGYAFTGSQDMGRRRRSGTALPHFDVCKPWCGMNPTAATIPKLSRVLDMRPLAVIPTHGTRADARLVYLPVELPR